MKRLFLLLHFTFCILPSAFCISNDGYPLANFGLTVNASADGSMFGEVLQNTGALGEWLTEKGSVQFYVEKRGKSHDFAGFKEKRIERKFPFVRGSYAQSPLAQAEMKTLAFCPLAVDDAETSALPVVMLEVTLKNTGKKAEELSIVVDAGRNADAGFALSASAKVIFANGKFSVPVKILPNEEKPLRFAVAFYDSTWTSARQFSAASQIADYARDSWDSLLAKTRQLEKRIPQTGDAALDEYLRWYMVPAVSLTRITKRNEVLTMGYSELNQRDSYWTSWLHLAFYRDLEKRMIAESIEWMQPSGKIPTTILPLIEREDDLDINAFFILRAWRYFRHYEDGEALAAWWKPLQKAMDWLISRDANGVGAPMQISFWGDWKDVQGIEGRRYSPFSVMTYLAALDRMAQAADRLNDLQAAQKYRIAYQKAADFLNKPTGEGGMWSGSYYCQLWSDGSVNERLLQDQMIGAFFGVVPRDRAAKIVEALNKQNLTKWGIAETTPYYPAEWGYEEATYHNGGVWPWLSFMDCWARLKMGRTDEALALVKRVAKADLADSGDWSPNEHINSLTGENLGFRIQGWNAALFGLVYFGLGEY
ncbi:MAG: hypothetical protein LBG47_10480 [Prevotellaceae bacterium]|jgi:glycogen debranching enzyme|nr:hypothetical protein [Prevotellaceae bacterium]